MTAHTTIIPVSLTDLNETCLQCPDDKAPTNPRKNAVILVAAQPAPTGMLTGAPGG